MRIELKTGNTVVRVSVRHAVKLLSQTSARPVELLMAMRARPYAVIRTPDGDLVCRPSRKKGRPVTLKRVNRVWAIAATNSTNS